jgi:glycine cleavage system H protein
MPDFNMPEDLYYHAETHLWAKVEGNLVRVGLDDMAQYSARAIANIRLKPPGRLIPKDRPFGTMEAGKYVGPLNLPVAAKVIEINEEVINNPKIANSDPYKTGWLVLAEPENLARDLPTLVSGEAIRDWVAKTVADWTARGIIKP